jgi:sulfur-oxidizing protein SoxY
MRMRLSRRRLLEGSLALLAVPGLPAALRADDVAAVSVGAAVEATDAGTALRRLFGDAEVIPSAAVKLTLPTMVDNGANVPVAVATTLTGVRSMALVVDRNPRPLAAWFELGEGMRPAIDTRIKLGETSTVRAIVQTGDGLFGAAADVTVTVGGCA